MATKRTRKLDADSPLNAREQAFVREYLIDLNGAAAARRAGYSERTARQQAARMLTKANIVAALAIEQKQRAERTKIDADWLLHRLVIEAQADIADLFTEAGNIKPVHEWPLIWRQGLVAGIEAETSVEKGSTGTGQWHGEAQDVHEEASRTETTVTKIKFSDRIKRVELIGRHIDVQAFKDRKEISADEPLRQLAQQIGGQSIRPNPGSGTP